MRLDKSKVDYLHDIILQKEQQKIEHERQQNQANKTPWFQRKKCANSAWKKIITSFNNKGLHASSDAIFDAVDVDLIDLRLIRNIVVVALNTSKSQDVMFTRQGPVLEGRR